ncbi:hypothetical protein AAKU52_000431 [Pedobacter sp. CG_S7]|uniref:hypothetical protein n=1 Tax=Pedobacter sp. CG_S7 TaxID=3143930 RepID=UPI003398201E
MKIILTSFFLAFSLNLCAQSNFYKLSLGGGAGFTKSYADLQEHNYGEAIYGTADFSFTPFLSLGFEIQNGTVKGGQSNQEAYNRKFKNNYRSLSANGKVSLGAFVDYQNSLFFDYIKGLYLGAGVGAIQNRVTELQRENNTPEQVYMPTSKEIFIPLNLGINYYIPNRYGQYSYVVNVNYQSNITLGEGLDGYDSSTVRYKNGNPDVFTYITLGIKYNFGPIGVSNKTFKRY